MQVKIRNLTPIDAETSVKWRNTPEIWVHTKFKATQEITLKDEIDWIERVTHDPTSARFGITVDNVYVGNIYLTNIHDGVAEYHIFIGNMDYRGKGVARVASVLIINFAKQKLLLNSIILNVKKNNSGAFHLYSSLGFTETGETEDGFTVMKLKLDSWNSDPRAKIK